MHSGTACQGVFVTCHGERVWEFTDTHIARSASCLLSLNSEILNISTGPHEFKMDSHIGITFPKGVGMFSEDGTSGPVRGCYSSVDVLVFFKHIQTSHFPREIVHCHCGNQIEEAVFFCFFFKQTTLPGFFFMLLGITPRRVPYIKTLLSRHWIKLIYESSKLFSFSHWLRIKLVIIQ